MSTRKAALALSAAALTLALAAAAGGQTFELTVIPPLDTPIGELPVIVAWDINDKGEVAGEARNPATGRSAAVRYSAARGLEDLDPTGEYNSEGWAISPKGLVFGLIPGRAVPNEEIFVHDKRTGFDFLEKGKTDDIKTGFLFGFRGRGALPRSGKVFGSVVFLTDDSARLAPYIYTRKRGWQDLSGVHPRFAVEPTFGAYINEAGHLVFVISGNSPPGEQPPTGRQDVFVRLRNGSLHELISPGRPVTPGSRPNRKGRMAGVYFTDDARERAYVFTPQTGLVTIHPDGPRESFALGTNKRGESYGALRNGKTHADLFVHTDRGGVEVVASRSRFEELARGRKGSYHEMYPEDINDKGEIVGCVDMRKGPDFPFLYSPEHGLFDLDAEVKRLDPSLAAVGCAELINNRSEALINVRGGGRTSAAILKLVG